MSKIFIVLIIFIFGFSKTYSQSLIIEELNVSHFKIKKNPNVFIEGESDGPFVRIIFTVNNNTEKDVFLKPNYNNLILSFNYDGEKITEKMVWESEEGQNCLEIKANHSREFSTSTYLFLGTSILEEKKYDYTLELLKVLPTLKLKYSDAKLELISTIINNVIIK